MRTARGARPCSTRRSTCSSWQATRRRRPTRCGTTSRTARQRDGCRTRCSIRAATPANCRVAARPTSIRCSTTRSGDASTGCRPAPGSTRPSTSRRTAWRATTGTSTRCVISCPRAGAKATCRMPVSTRRTRLRNASRSAWRGAPCPPAREPARLPARRVAGSAFAAAPPAASVVAGQHARGLRLPRPRTLGRAAAAAAARPPGARPVVDVLVPVHAGVQEDAQLPALRAPGARRRCLRARRDRRHEPRAHALSAWLRELAARGLLTLHVNDANLGFVRTVNRGLALHPEPRRRHPQRRHRRVRRLARPPARARADRRTRARRVGDAAVQRTRRCAATYPLASAENWTSARDGARRRRSARRAGQRGMLGARTHRRRLLHADDAPRARRRRPSRRGAFRPRLQAQEERRGDPATATRCRLRLDPAPAATNGLRAPSRRGLVRLCEADEGACASRCSISSSRAPATPATRRASPPSPTTTAWRPRAGAWTSPACCAPTRARACSVCARGGGMPSARSRALAALANRRPRHRGRAPGRAPGEHRSIDSVATRIRLRLPNLPALRPAGLGRWRSPRCSHPAERRRGASVHHLVRTIPPAIRAMLQARSNACRIAPDHRRCTTTTPPARA